MPTPTIDATVGGQSANSYVLVADADQYASERIPAPAAYNAASATDKAAALIMACRRLQQEEFDGVPIVPFSPTGGPGQALHWPRWGCIDLNGFPIIANTSIPDFVKRAQMELAFALLAEDIVSNTGLEPYTDVTVGSLKVTPDKSFRAYPLPESCRREIAHVLASGGNGIRVERA